MFLLGLRLLAILFVTTVDTATLKTTSVTEAVTESMTSSLEEDRTESHFGEWSAWSRCSRRCREVRSRLCLDEEHCGSSVLKEERSCTGGRCKGRVVVVPHSGEVTQRGRSPVEFRILFQMQNVVYSSWSEWSGCSKACRTHRSRTCEVEEMCGNVVQDEEAMCYVVGSSCHKVYRQHTIHYSPAREQEAEMESSRDIPPSSLDDQECGVPDIDSEMSLRIIGGREAVKGKWPWQVLILNRHKEPFCGGTILSPQWVLTAAHCVRRRLFVRAGEHDIAKDEGTEQQMKVAEAIVHPDYDPETVDNDIALLKLRQPLQLDTFVKAACLPEPVAEIPPQARAFILGWGKRGDTAWYGTDVLHEAEVPVVDSEDCRAVYDDYFISPNMLCAGYRKGRVDSCAGDSGGPLLYKDGDRWAVHGVTSFGDGCGKKGKFGIYAKVSNYIGWIKKMVGKKS